MKQLNKDVYNRIYTLLVMYDGDIQEYSSEFNKYLDTIIHFNTLLRS